MKTTQLDLYPKPRVPYIESSITVQDYVTYVKEGYNAFEVLSARRFQKGSPDYVKIKEARKCVTFNFNFRKHKTNANIIRPTNLLYFDIDKGDFDISKLDMDKIFILNKSFGGNGYNLIVKVNSMPYTSHNDFKQAYLSIAEQLGINGMFDSGAVKMTQYTIISYDPQLIVNYDSIVLKPVIVNNIPLIKVNRKSITTPIMSVKNEERREKREEKRISGCDTFLKLNFRSVLDDYNGEDCVYLPQGKEYIESFIPFLSNGNRRTILNGNKHKVITLYVTNLLYLNPNASLNQILQTVKMGILPSCEEIVPDENIITIIKYKIKELESGNLVPYVSKIKKYWVNPLVPKENRFKAYIDKKRSLGADLLDAFFGDEICNLNSKITYKLIADIIGVSEITIKRRINEEQKLIIKEHNNNLKGAITPIIQL